ncbi:MAG: DUF4254 domain-containing protein [Chitinophagia bacterium]|nr:DUF4254 domain-containing protein [Chitinophagia bacterium]
MNLSSTCINIFEKATEDYHINNDVNGIIQNPYPESTFEYLLYKKNYIDAVQWHLEDIVRNPTISPEQGLMIKRRIDQSNQDRTNLVEKIDDYFLQKYAHVECSENARLNTESPAWAIDRLSILVLKIYHMQEEVMRKDADSLHIQNCESKLKILLEQKADLSAAIDELILDIAHGYKKMKVYRQMKMYNDPTLNPVLYSQSKH